MFDLKSEIEKEKVNHLQRLSDALPVDVHWNNDPITPEIADVIWQAAIIYMTGVAEVEPIYKQLYEDGLIILEKHRKQIGYLQKRLNDIQLIAENSSCVPWDFHNIEGGASSEIGEIVGHIIYTQKTVESSQVAKAEKP